MADSAHRRGVRSALIVATGRYDDPSLAGLRGAAADVDALASVFGDPDVGAFDVQTVVDQPAHVVSEAVEEFFADRSPDDLLVLHFSGHGIKNQDGELHFAAANTRLSRLASTSVAANFVNRQMTASRSRRIVLLLDCCYAGAFDRGMATRGEASVEIQERFGGRGRAVITASGALEYALDGERVTSDEPVQPSVFTRAMVRGLTSGDADRNQDGWVGLDELYDYVYDAVREVSPHQTPGKWTFGLQGDLQLARRSRPVTTPSPLPPEIQQSLDSPLAGVRTGAVQDLARLACGAHAGLALGARLALERLANDDSRTVMTAATAALDALADRNAEPTAPAPPPDPQPDGAAERTLVDAPGAAQPPQEPVPAAAPTAGQRGPSRRTRTVVAAAAVAVVAGLLVWATLGQDAGTPASFGRDGGNWVGNPFYEGQHQTVNLYFETGSTDAVITDNSQGCLNGHLRNIRGGETRIQMDYHPTDPGCVSGVMTAEVGSSGDSELVLALDADADGEDFSSVEFTLEPQ